MAKHIILDSMARSGTTLMSAILRSQEKTMCFCPGFNELLSCKNIGSWPHEICRAEFMKNSEIDFENFKNESFSQIVDYSQYYGLTENEWRSIIFDSNSTADIRKNIEAAFPEVEVFCYRWNQALSYFYEWTNYGDDYLWISMIRNPMDRAISSFEKHRWEIKESLSSTLGFLDKMKYIDDDKKICLVYYEDLVENAEKQISNLYRFFDCKIERINLTKIKGSNGKSFIPQSSTIKNIDKKEDGYLTDSDEFSGMYKDQIDRYKTSTYIAEDGTRFPIINEETYQVFEKFLSDCKQYKRYFKV